MTANMTVIMKSELGQTHNIAKSFQHFIRALALLMLIAFTAHQADAKLIKKDVDYNVAGRPYQGYLVYDDSRSGIVPGLLVAHNWMGITDETKSKADQMAALGYVVFAVDIYGKDRRPKNTDEAGQMAGAFKKDRTLLRSHMQEGLSQLLKSPGVDKNKVAVLGYCFGGTAAIELGRAGADVKGIVTFHGGLDSPNPSDGKKIKGRLIAFHGADDPFVPAKDVAAFEDELRQAKIDWELVQFGGAVHSFTEQGAGSDNSKGAAYNANADKRSWIAMQNFLAETFK